MDIIKKLYHHHLTSSPFDTIIIRHHHHSTPSFDIIICQCKAIPLSPSLSSSLSSLSPLFPTNHHHVIIIIIMIHEWIHNTLPVDKNLLMICCPAVLVVTTTASNETLSQKYSNFNIEEVKLTYGILGRRSATASLSICLLLLWVRLIITHMLFTYITE